MRRRTFLKTSLAAGAAFCILPSRVRAGTSSNESLQIGVIGTGRMGHNDLKHALECGIRPENHARIVAVCDVDSRRLAHAKGQVETFYREQEESGVAIEAYGDFQALLASPSIDAVLIATPDHWHGVLGVAAANAGKHVYLEKPQTNTLAEGQALVKAVRRNGIVLQTGSQQRSSMRFRRVCEIIRNNWLGELVMVEVQVPADEGTAFVSPTDPPPNLDYERWLGPAPEAPYTEARVHPQADFGRPGWMQVEAYCRGMITNWGAHMYDIAQWAIGADDSGPVEVRCKGQFPDRGVWDVHVGYEGEAVYANGVRVVSRNGSPGVRFVTQNGWAYVSRERFDCSDPDLLLRDPTEGEVSLRRSRDHMEDFLQSARAGRDPICPVEVGHRSNTVCLLHHSSMKLGGRTIRWDPAKEVPLGDPEVETHLNRPLRAPWTL